MAESVAFRYLWGSIPFSLHVTISDAMIFQFFGPDIVACKERIFAVEAIGRIVRSTGLCPFRCGHQLETKFTPSQYLAMYFKASPRGDLAKTRARC